MQGIFLDGRTFSSFINFFLKIWASYLGGGGAVRGLLACRGVLPASQQPQVYDSFLFFVVVWVSNNFRMYLCLLIGSKWCYDFFVHYEKFSSPEVSTRPEHNSFSLSLVDKKSQPTRYISSDIETLKIPLFFRKSFRFFRVLFRCFFLAFFRNDSGIRPEKHRKQTGKKAETFPEKSEIF